MIDERLGQLAVEFWDLTWSDENRFLDYNMRLLLSLANAVGAGRKRRAMRELLKAYKNGIDSRAFDDVFEQFAWNMGIGFFSSEIAPSPLFQAYKLIKQMEKQEKSREEIAKVNDKFSMLNSTLGKIMEKKATIAEMSKKSGMDEDVLIAKITELIRVYS